MKINLNQLDIEKYMYDNQPTIYIILHKYYNHDQSKKKIIAYRMLLTEKIEKMKEDQLLELDGDENLIREILFDFEKNIPVILNLEKELS